MEGAGRGWGRKAIYRNDLGGLQVLDQRSGAPTYRNEEQCQNHHQNDNAPHVPHFLLTLDARNAVQHLCLDTSGHAQTCAAGCIPFALGAYLH